MFEDPLSLQGITLSWSDIEWDLIYWGRSTVYNSSL